MLMFPRTIELREKMLNSQTHQSKRCQYLVVAIIGLLSTLLPAQVFALQLSQPVGIQEIGRSLSLKSTVSGITPGAESQLRSTCLKARLRSIETGAADSIEKSNGEVWVDFQPTTRQGGVIEFKSALPVNDALVELELVSECPLVVFSSRWALIMESGSNRDGMVQSENRSAQKSRSFDVEQSVLLRASRREPKPIPSSSIPLPKDEEIKEKLAAVKIPEAEVLTPPAVNEGEFTPVALSPPAVENNELTQSTETSAQNTQDKQLLNQAVMALDIGKDPNDKPSSKPSSILSWIFAISLTLLALIGGWFCRKKWLQRRLNAKPALKHREPLLTENFNVPSDGIEDKAIQNDELLQNAQHYGNDRVLESLIGTDGSRHDNIPNPLSHLIQAEPSEVVSKSSLQICLDLIHKVDIRAWNLPLAFQELVAHRNKSLELHRTIDAVLLRCHIGVVELAFQDAKLGLSTDAQVAMNLITQVLSEQVFDMDSITTLGVPDIVKSHVRSKMCEISGAENRSILRENLINLNRQVLSQALCFHTNAWRELLSEEGIID